MLVTKVLLISSIISMIFAVLSIIPHRYFGKKFRKSEYQGVLYANNFSAYSLEEFQNEFDRMLSSGKAIYEELTRDIYFLGRVIAFRQKMLWFSTLVFLLGLILAMVTAVTHGLNWI